MKVLVTGARGMLGGAVSTVELQAEDGVLLIVLTRVLYAKRYARETRVGFDA